MGNKKRKKSANFKTVPPCLVQNRWYRLQNAYSFKTDQPVKHETKQRINGQKSANGTDLPT